MFRSLSFFVFKKATFFDQICRKSNFVQQKIIFSVMARVILKTHLVGTSKLAPIIAINIASGSTDFIRNRLCFVDKKLISLKGNLIEGKVHSFVNKQAHLQI